MSISSDTKVFTVICFDRMAKLIFGCSADEFFDFAKLHPFAGNLISSLKFSSLIFKFLLLVFSTGNVQFISLQCCLCLLVLALTNC